MTNEDRLREDAVFWHDEHDAQMERAEKAEADLAKEKARADELKKRVDSDEEEFADAENAMHEAGFEAESGIARCIRTLKARADRADRAEGQRNLAADRIAALEKAIDRLYYFNDNDGVAHVSPETFRYLHSVRRAAIGATSPEEPDLSACQECGKFREHGHKCADTTQPKDSGAPAGDREDRASVDTPAGASSPTLADCTVALIVTTLEAKREILAALGRDVSSKLNHAEELRDMIRSARSLIQKARAQ